MPDVNIVLNPDNFQLLSEYSNYGYKDRDEVVNSALFLLKKKIQRQNLVSSAEVYLDIYESDKELQDLTETALIDHAD